MYVSMFLAELFPYADIVYNVFLVLYFLTVLTVIIVVLSENRNPVKSMAWVLVLVLLPVVGLVIYLIFGRNLKGISLISRSHLRELRHMHNPPEYDHEAVAGLSEESQQLISLASKLSRPHLFVGNNIEVFTTGKEKFEALMRDLRAARQYIHVQYFIIEDDQTGSEFLTLLMEKAREGVQVKVLYDYVGSFYFKPRVLRRMREAGIDVHPFLKLTFTQFANRVNWRNHRKIVVIDGKIGYVGGMNMADRYVIGDKNWTPWRDTHLRINGEAVAALQYSFAIDWDFTTRELLTSTTMHDDTAPASRDYLVQMMTSGPTNRWNNISFIFLKAITLAKRCVYVQSPYFLPSDSLLKALQSAALAGVDVRLMIPRQSDSAMLRLATGSYYKECLLAGIKIYLYEPTIMHAKVVIVDDEFVTAGSTNFDFRSFEHNFEINALVYSKEFNEKMKRIFESDLEQCTRLLLSKWKQRPLRQKALESVVRLISPIL